MKIDVSYRVEVSREERPHTGTSWALFANYPNETEANAATDRALEEYPSVRQITERLYRAAA